MSFYIDRLYNLLPAIYRVRDVESGGQLRALLGVAAEQVAVLEEDLDQLYDDMFIETAADWVVPYIGDLVGYRSLHELAVDAGDPSASVASHVSNPRAEVANTIRFRRRKGTASMLEQLARDVTGWEAARVVEFFELLVTTQYLRHTRPENRAWVNLRRHEPLARIGSPFEEVARTLDVRHISSGRGRFNIPNVGLFLWRLRAQQISGGTARELSSGLYTFDPLGIDAPLFNLPRPEESITQLAGPINVPEPLRRRPLYDELEARRQALVDGGDPTIAPAYFLDDVGGAALPRAFRISVNGNEVPAAETLICDLSDPVTLPPDKLAYRPTGKHLDDVTPDPEAPIGVAVDPVLGRFAFPAGALPAGSPVTVDYTYGFSDDIGGGPYGRDDLEPPDVVVTTPLDLQVAIDALPPGANQVLQIEDSLTRVVDLTIAPAAGQRLTIQAAAGERAVIDGSIVIAGADDARVILDGLLLSGRILVTGSAGLTLVLRDCTLAPWRELDVNDEPKPLDEPSVTWTDTGANRLLVLDRAITGRLRLGDGVRIDVRDSIIDALSDDAMALAASADGSAPADRLTMTRTTVIGAIHVREVVNVEDSILTGVVTSDRRQQGCLRFSYLPPDSRTPRQYRCQPEMAIRAAVDATGNPAVAADIAVRLQPVFTSRTWIQPAYMQLRHSCPSEIRGGSEDGGEMGVFHDLYQMRRESNLRARLDEYLRVGLEAGIFYAT